MTELFLIVTIQYAVPLVVFVLVLAISTKPMPIRFVLAVMAGGVVFLAFYLGGSRLLWRAIHHGGGAHLQSWIPPAANEGAGG